MLLRRRVRPWWRWVAPLLSTLAPGVGAVAVPLEPAYTPCQEVPPVLTGANNPFGPYFSPITFDGETMLRAQRLCYGNYESWYEAAFGQTYDVQLDRRFEFYRPGDLPLQWPIPLIIWAHPNGQSEAMGFQDENGDYPALAAIVKPAIANGFAVMSVEYRHPRASVPYTPPPPPPPPEPPPPQYDIPDTDIAVAIQWVRSRAAELGVHADDVFVLGQSRGSLGVLTALMPDQASNVPADAAWSTQSSKPRAAFAVQGQTSFAHEQLRDTFLRHDASPEAARLIAALPLEYPSCLKEGPAYDYHCHFDRRDPVFSHPGSAIDELDLGDPPVWLRYDRRPTDPQRKAVVPLGTGVAQAGEDQATGPCYEPAPPGCFDVHHPNFGLALRLRFLQLGPSPKQRAYVYVQFGNGKGTPWAASHFFDDYFCFFIQNLTEEGAVVRRQARPTPDCALHEWDLWPPPF